MTAEWDPVNGVFVGDRAASAGEDVPSPLWIFGYGSLVWRPEAEWAAYDRVEGVVCRGWQRYFAQRSTDHRGTPEAPGLVCTLLQEPGAATTGVAYRVPDEDAHAVLDGLDFREKGGCAPLLSLPPRLGVFGHEKNSYTRTVARVDFANGTSVEALVYSATRDNPHFVADLASDEPGAVDASAAIIARARGPSGANAEYLAMLAEALPDDAYLAALQTRVLAYTSASP